MKTLFLIPALALVSTTAHAIDEGTMEFGLYGGYTSMDHLEVLGSSWNITPRAGYFVRNNVAVELDLGFSGGQTRIGTPDTFGYFVATPRVNLVGTLFEDADFHPLLAMGVGGMFKNINDDGALDLPTGNNLDFDFLVDAGPGIMVPLGPVAIRTDLRWLLSLGTENYQNRGDAFIDWEWTLGAMVLLGGARDSDKDGIVDEEDSCVDQAEDVDEFEDEDGCPEYDNDADGIDDADDACPNEAEDKDGFEDENGCPEPDNDMDNVLDADDECPTVPGTEATKGCPDADGDGLTDEDDECAEDAGPEKSFGCPDGDEDRVPDYRDDCPEEAAAADINPQRSDGCPSRVYVSEKTIVITEVVQFASGRSTIKRESYGLLDDIATVLTKRKGIKKVEVGGHTDSQGNDDGNMKLSEDRVRAVVDYLVEKGVDQSRLKAKGYGETKPIADNDTAEGRAQNRRVEFNILEQDKIPSKKRKKKD